MAIAIYSCNNDSNNEKEINAEKQVTENIIEELVSKYRISYDWDTVRYPFSIDYKPVLNTQYQFISYFRVIDIYESDSSNTVCIKASVFYFYFPVSREQINILESSKDLMMIVSIDKIKKIEFGVTGKIEDSDTEDDPASVILNIETPRRYRGTGKIIEIVSPKK